MNLDGTNIFAGPSPINLAAGTMHVTANSALSGPILCGATLTINSSQQLTLSSATVSLTGGSTTNNGTLAIGASTLSNTTASAYSLSGSGTATLAGGSVTGANGYTSTTTVRGYGNVTAPYTNGGQVIAAGNGTEQTLNMSSVTPVANTGALGWYAQDHGQLLLPALTVGSAGNYNWGGDPTTLGMVNSVGVSFAGSVTPGSLAIALRSPDRVDVPAGLVDAIGVWQFTPSALAGAATLTFRYDDAAVTSLGADPHDLQLLENLGGVG